MDDFESVIEQLKQELGEDKITTTSDPKIKRPEKALERDMYKDFMDRNPLAGGGMLVQPSADGSRPGYAGDDGDYIYTRESGAKRLMIGDTNYGQVAKGDKKGLEALKKKRDKLVASGKLNLRTKYDLEALKNEWRKTLPTKKATNWESFLRTKFPKGSTTPNSIRKKTESDFRKGESDFNPKEEFKNIVKTKKQLNRIKEAKKLVEAHNKSDKFLYDKKTIYKKLGFVAGKPQLFGKYYKTGQIYKSPYNEALIKEVEKLIPIEKKISNAFDKILNENLKIYEPKGGNKEKAGGILKRMISDIVSPKGGPKKYQVSSRLITSVLSKHKPYLKIKNDFDYLEQNLARKMKGNTFNEAMDYAKYVRGGLQMNNIEKLSRNFLLPESNIMKFALRSAFNNYKLGNTNPPVKVFNLKADGTPGKPVDFGKLKIDVSTNMKKIDINKIGFTYNDEFFTKNNIRTKGRELGFFDEVYRLTAKGNMPVPNPKNLSKDITLNELLQLNKDKLTIGHNDAKGGITKLPFSDLRLEGGKINIALYNAYNKIQNKPLRKLIVNKLQGDFGFLKGDKYEQAFIEGERNKAINIAKKNITERTLYRQAGQDVITDLGTDLLKKKEPFQKELFRVAGMTVPEIDDLLFKLSGQIDRDCAGAIKQASKDGGRIGLQSIGSRNACITKAKNYMSEQLERGIGTQQNAKTSLIKRILAGSANFIKQNLSPKELLKMENLIGKPALYGAALFETGLIADDVLRKGQPLNVSAAESLFGSVLNLDADAARAKNLLESNVQLSPAAQEYAQNILDYDKYRKLDLSFPSSLIASKMPGSDRYFKMQEELRNKIANTPDTGALDYQSALDEAEGTFKAKPKFLDAPDAPEVTPLTNKLAKPAGRRIGPMTAKQDMQIDLSLPTYDRSFTASDDFLNQYLKSIGKKPLAPGEGTLFRMQEPNQRGLFGANEKFAGGGIAKMAGVDSGPPPESGPLSQGLPGLLKRGIKT